MTSRFSRYVLGIFGTRAAWAAMGVVSGAILARWLGPHDRGILALVLLLPSTVVTLAKLGISQANVYFINREKAGPGQVASNTVALALTSGTVAAVVAWGVSGNLLASVLRGVPDWAITLALLRVPMMLMDNYLYGVLQATGKFGVYNVRLILSEALRLVLVALALIVLDGGLFAAVLIYTLIAAVNVIWLTVSTNRQLPFSSRIDYALLGGQLVFGLKSYVQTVTAHLLLRIDIYMVAYFLTPAETAFYALALHFTELVLEFPQAIGLVLYPRLASVPEEEVHRLTAQASRRTLLMTAPLAFVLGWLGPYLVVLWYGAPFAPAGKPLPWAAAGVMMMSMFVILTRDFTSRGQQRVNILSGLIALASNVALNLYMIPRFGIVGAAVATAISYVTACACLLVFFVREARTSPLEVILPKRDDLRFLLQQGRNAGLYLRRLLGANTAGRA